MKLKLIILSICLTLLASTSYAQWGSQPWGFNPFRDGMFGIGPWGSASSTSGTSQPDGSLLYQGDTLLYQGDTLTYVP